MDHLEELSSLGEGKSRVVAASVVNARLYWRICATHYMGRKEQIRLSWISRCAFFLLVVEKNSTVFDECIFHHAYCYVLYRRYVPRVCSSMNKYVIMSEYSQVYEHTVESRGSHLRRGEKSRVLILKKQFQVCIFKQLFESFVNSFRSSRSLSKNDEKKGSFENEAFLRYVR